MYDTPNEDYHTPNESDNPMSIISCKVDHHHEELLSSGHETQVDTKCINTANSEETPKRRDEHHTAMDCDSLTLLELIGIDVDQVPPYLCQIDGCFDKLMHFMQPNISKQDLEEFRYVATVMHKILLVEKLTNLCKWYRKSSFVPLDIAKRFQQLQPNIRSNYICAHVRHIHEPFIRINVGESENRCQAFIDKCLEKLSEKSKEYYDQLQSHTFRLTDHAYDVKQTIQKFIKQQFKSQSLEYDCNIESVQYQYIGAILQQQFADELPNERHVKRKLF